MAGDFEAFVDAAQPPLLRFALLLTGSRHDAEDLLQGALEKVCRSWKRVREMEQPLAYTKRTMVNLHTSRWRKLRREVLSGDGPPDRGHELRAAPPVEDPMWGLLATLPPRQRAVLVLRYYEDLSEREIAETLGCTVGTVKSQASRALDKLRASLTEPDPTRNGAHR